MVSHTVILIEILNDIEPVQKLTEIKKNPNTSCEVEVIQIHTTRNKKTLNLLHKIRWLLPMTTENISNCL